MDLLKSLATFSSFKSPLTTHPWVISGNSVVPTLSAPNLLINNSTISPFSLTSAGSFAAGNKQAGHFIFQTKSSQLPPQNLLSAPKDGCGPAMALKPSYLVANLKADHTPQQKPIPKYSFIPLLSIRDKHFQKRLLIFQTDCPLILATIASILNSPAYRGSRTSGMKTWQPREANISATT